MSDFEPKPFNETCVPTNELRFVNRREGDHRVARVLQQKWTELNVEEKPGTFEWRDVPFDPYGH